MFGIDYASRCSKSKRNKYRKSHIALELEEFFLSFGFLETSKRGFFIALSVTCVLYLPVPGEKLSR